MGERERYRERERERERERKRETERERERERERDGSDVTLVALRLAMSFALLLAKNLHLNYYWRRILHFSLLKICTFVSPLLNGAEFTLSVAKALHSSKQFPFGLLLSNGVKMDRRTETSDRISGCTALLLIEKLNQINTKNYWK